MSNIKQCRFCAYGKPERQKDGLIRCIRYSCWVEPLDQRECYCNPGSGDIAWEIARKDGD